MLVVLDEIVVDLSCLRRSFAESFLYGYFAARRRQRLDLQ
jgi:hypothetical protein